MGREVKRVALDFDWPLSKVWEGFLTPERFREEPCPDCGNGWSAGAEWLKTYLYRLGMLAEHVARGRSRTEMHPWLAHDPYPPQTPHYSSNPGVVVQPDASVVELVDAILGPEFAGKKGPFGSTDEHRMMYRLVELLGLPEDWVGCKTCKGHATLERYPGQRSEAEAWESFEPPAGEGWQLWETVSEGSPISPVFATKEELSAWMQSDKYKWGATKAPLTKEQADAFVDAGWAPSGVFTPETGFVRGEEMPLR